jgi:hypothetical protein
MLAVKIMLVIGNRINYSAPIVHGAGSLLLPAAINTKPGMRQGLFKGERTTAIVGRLKKLL